MSTLRKRKPADTDDCAATTCYIPSGDEWKSRAAKVIRMLDKWAVDDSGYDEQTLPDLKKALNHNRTGARRLFNGKA